MQETSNAFPSSTSEAAVCQVAAQKACTFLLIYVLQLRDKAIIPNLDDLPSSTINRLAKIPASRIASWLISSIVFV